MGRTELHPGIWCLHLVEKVIYCLCSKYNGSHDPWGYLWSSYDSVYLKYLAHGFSTTTCSINIYSLALETRHQIWYSWYDIIYLPLPPPFPAFGLWSARRAGASHTSVSCPGYNRSDSPYSAQGTEPNRVLPPQFASRVQHRFPTEQRQFSSPH